MPKNKCGHYIQSFSLRSFSTAQTIQSERGVVVFFGVFFCLEGTEASDDEPIVQTGTH